MPNVISITYLIECDVDKVNIYAGKAYILELIRGVFHPEPFSSQLRVECDFVIV